MTKKISLDSIQNLVHLYKSTILPYNNPTIISILSLDL